MVARQDFPWPRLIAVAAGICLVVGWLADSLLVIALAPVLGTAAWLLTRRQTAKPGNTRPTAPGGKARPTPGGGKGRQPNAKSRPRR